MAGYPQAQTYCVPMRLLIYSLGKGLRSRWLSLGVALFMTHLLISTLWSQQEVLNVRDYGATGNGQADDGPAFREAIAELKPGQHLFIPAGQYRLMPDTPWDSENKPEQAPDILAIENLNNNIIYGEKGTNLIMGVPGNGLIIRHCQELTLRQLTIDYQPLSFTQGTVVDSCPDEQEPYFLIRIDPGYADPVKPIFAGMLHAVFIDPKTRQFDHTLGEAYVKKVEQQSEGLFRVYTSNHYSDQIPEVGLFLPLGAMPKPCARMIQRTVYSKTLRFTVLLAAVSSRGKMMV